VGERPYGWPYPRRPVHRATEEGGQRLSGSSGTSSTGGWDVSIYIDKDCRVFVSSITRSSGQGGPPPSGGTFVTPELVPSPSDSTAPGWVRAEAVLWFPSPRLEALAARALVKCRFVTKRLLSPDRCAGDGAPR
jgi:hypothetical protein